ncbi:Krr1-domain-containing protein [Leucogyrophana mollusca]|uniref:Krr1-domain-containing protein n=1 Tax=Leucogyrophana mollusca TaxID=85980 RepID=A0ACB8BHV5_9AGAM|nr:Krr1-domain-containing protein [Leucogyrophana mollusca]
MLSDSDSDGEDLHKLTVNEHYAKAFEYKKEREELAKLKEKYGSDYGEDDEETDSEDAESEDEDGEELTPAVDAAILRTLARIRRRDPEIYNSGKSIFEEEQDRTAEREAVVQRKVKDKSKPVTIRQVALESALHATSRSPSPEPLAHVEEQRMLQDETRAAFHRAVDGDDDEDDGLLVPREKTRDEVEREEEEYRAYLEREVGEDLGGLVVLEDGGAGSVDVGLEDRGEESGSPKKKKGKKKEKEKEKGKGKDKQETDHEFLMNYILNRGWIDRTSRRVPTYKEITKAKSKSKKKDDEGSDSGEDVQMEEGDGDAGIVEEDEEEFEEIAERFETSYNFRFEEPDAATIKTFPRVLPSTVRREDTTRKDARARKKERKEEELEKKREEVRRMKALKMKEVRRRLERIGREGGVGEDDGLAELDLEGDWDPTAHDAQMAGLYGEGDGSEVDEEKPTWDDDIDIDDIVPPEKDEASSSKKKKKEKKKDKKKRKDTEEEDGWGMDVDAMDADIQRDDAEEEWDGTEEMRKRKLEEYMDEVYGLEFNDVVAGMPTRFKYATTAPQTFALTPAEILMATDQELNQYMSVKRYAPYRAEKWDRDRGERLKEFRDKVRERVGGSGFADKKDGNGGEEKPKKRMGKKERQRLKAAAEGAATEGKSGAVAPEKSGEAKNRKRKSEDAEQAPGDEDGPVEGEDGPKKKRRRRHKKSAQQ